MTAAEKEYELISQDLPEAQSGQMFGKRCLKINGKAFASFHEDDMVFKLPEPVHSEALDLAGACLFDPSGKKRPMKEWVQVPVAHVAHWRPLATAALQYVAVVSGK